MKNLELSLPTMYGDHHVLEVRRILLELPGVKDLYASSAFQFLQVSFDESKTAEKDILAKLEEAGYLGEFLIPQEIDLPANEHNDPKVFRHTAAFAQTKQISFLHQNRDVSRPLWPCPGMGLIKNTKVED